MVQSYTLNLDPARFLLYHLHLLLRNASPKTTSLSQTAHSCLLANTLDITIPRSSGLLMGSHWRNLRRIASLELLSSSRLQMFHDIRADEVRSLICKLFRWPNGSEPQSLDMKSTFFELILNVLMRVIAGKRYYGEDIGESSEAKMFEQIVKESFQLSAPNIGDFLPVLKYVGSGRLEKKLVKLQKKRDMFMQYLIEERRKVQTGFFSEERSKTMVDVLLSLQDYLC
ncbi:hypothetical protein ACLB2K_017624 [Fragaria x ananassa]